MVPTQWTNQAPCWHCFLVGHGIKCAKNSNIWPNKAKIWANMPILGHFLSKIPNFHEGYRKVIRCLARISPSTTTTNQPTNRAPNELASLTQHEQQSQKNPVSASAMLTGKFLQIQKVFATSSLLA